MSESSPHIACPNCGKQYRWKPQLAGKKTECSACRQKLRIPAQPGDPVEAIGGLLKDQSHESEGAYELAVDDDHGDAHLDPNAGRKGGQSVSKAPPPLSPDNCPSCNSRLKPGAVICINCGYHVAEGKKISTAVAKDVVTVTEGGGAARTAAPAGMPNLGAYAKAAQRTILDNEALAADQAHEQHRKDVVIPLVLLGIGLAGILLNKLVIYRFVFNIHAQNAFDAEVKMAQAWGGTPPTAPDQFTMLDGLLQLVGNAVVLIIQIPLFLIAIVLVSKLFGTSFGKLGTAMLKLLALAVFVNMCDGVTSSLLDIVTGGYGGIGVYVALAVNFGVFFTLAVWLYELDAGEAVVMWLLVFLVPWIVLFLVGAIILGMIM